MDSYSTAQFIHLDVRSSSLVLGADNHVQIRFALDRYMPLGSTIEVQIDFTRLSVPNGRATVRGHSHGMFERMARWDESTSSLVMTTAHGIPARTNLSVSVLFVNSDASKISSSLEVSVSSRSDYFTSRRSKSVATVGKLVAAHSQILMEVPSSKGNLSSGPPNMSKSIMMDLTALNSVFVSSIALDVPSSAQTVDVYYKQGSYESAIRNLSEWRLLGRAYTQSLKRDNDGFIRLRLSDLGTHFSEAEARQLGQDMSDPAGIPGVTSPQTWLGPRPHWVENSPQYMSSSLGRGVDVKQVFNLSKSALWHSGNGTSIWSEMGCPHLPKCPQDWPFNKRQWLAMDTQVCYTMSAFRTTFPNHTQAPAYYYGGTLRSNIDAEDWYSAHYKHFELQYSMGGLEGPWHVALRGEAQAPRSVQWPEPSPGETQGPRVVWAGGDKAQEFFFQPITARYWRIVFEDTFGFGFVALQSIEFFGFKSPWCSSSKWCQHSHLCRNAHDNAVSAHYSQDVQDWPKVTLHDNGLALTAGLHSLLLSGSHGFFMSETKARRSDVSQASASLLLHHAAQIDRVCATGSSTCAQNAKARIEPEYVLKQWTSPVGALKHLRLPTRLDLCFRSWRILVKGITNSSSGGPVYGGAPVCLNDIVLYSQAGPDWIVQQVSADDIAVHNASSELDGYPVTNAFDGNIRTGNDRGNITTFCWDTKDKWKWISLTFKNETCLEGYAVFQTDDIFRLTEWELQGLQDEMKWVTIDRRRHMAAGNLLSNFALSQELITDYLFANGLTYGFSNPMNPNLNDESPRLYRFDGIVEGWSIHQIVSGGGAHDVEHFVIDQEHFLGVARSMTSAGPGQNSEILRWNGLAFVSDHKLQIGWCTSIEYFKSNASHYIVASDHGQGVPFDSVELVILQYQGAAAGWRELQRAALPSAASIHDIILISAFQNVYLVAAVSPFNDLCQGAFSCMQSAVFECDENNRTQDIRFHRDGHVMVQGGVLQRTPRCRWVIAPPNSAEVAVYFEHVHSLACCFRITVSSCADATCTNRTILSQYSPTADHAGNLDAIGKMNTSSPTGVLAMELERFTQHMAGGTSTPQSTEEYLRMRFTSTETMPVKGSLEIFRWRNADTEEPRDRFESTSSVSLASKDGNDQVALDLEHFERDGKSYVVVPSVLSSVPTSPSADTLIYELQSGSLTLSERLEGEPAVRCRHINKDGLDYLLLASYSANLQVFRWSGTRFESSTSYPGAISNVETIAIGDSILISAVDSPGDSVHAYWRSSSPEPTWIRLLRWNDAMVWHGTIEFSHAFTPSASFVIRQLKETTLLASRNRTFVATLRPDRSLPPGVTIRISDIAGAHHSDISVDVMGPDAATFSGAGTWIQSTRELRLQTSKWITSQHNVSFRFSLDKDFEPRAALNARIACEGQIIILPQTMENIGKYWPAQTGRLRQDCNVGYSAVDGFPCRECASGFYKVACM